MEVPPSPWKEPALEPQRQRQAREYALRQRLLSLAGLALGAGLLLALLLSGLSLRLREALPLPYPLQVAAYALALILGYGLLSLPLTYYEGYVLPRRYGLSTQSLPEWLWDLAKGGLVSLALGLPLMVALYQLLARSPSLWWLWAGLLVFLLSGLLTHLAPVLLLPLFFQSQPLDNPSLAQRLSHLTERAGRRVRGVYTINASAKGTTANAALAGLGPTRRILLTDTLLESYTSEEIEVILAHELGHDRRHHIPQTLGLLGLLNLGVFLLAHLLLREVLPAFSLDSLADVAAFPLLALALGSLLFLAGPAQKAWSRRLETQADREALGLSGNPQAFLTMLAKLTDQNLAEANPPRWVELLFHDHPPYSQRQGLALAWSPVQEKESPWKSS